MGLKMYFTVYLYFILIIYDPKRLKVVIIAKGKTLANINVWALNTPDIFHDFLFFFYVKNKEQNKTINLKHNKIYLGFDNFV